MLYDQKWDKAIEPDTNEDWRAVLRRAANLIEHTGWNQHSSICHDLAGRITGYCALGAIDFSGGSLPDKGAAAEKLSAFLISRGSFTMYISHWNDSQTDKQVVIDALRQAAEG